MSDGKKASGGLGDQFLSHMRGFLFTAFSYTPLGTSLGFNPLTHNPWYQRTQVAVNESLKDTVRDFVLGVGLVGALVGTNEKQTANRLADNVEKFWRSNIGRFNPQIHNAEFRMASGWQLPTGVKYNGQLRPDMEGKEISSLTAVFYKNPKGEIEVFDISDPRWTNLAAPYIAGQILLPLGAGKGIAAAISAVSKTERGVALGRLAGAATVTAGYADNLGTGSQIFVPMHSGLVLEPRAISTLASMFDDSKKMTDAVLIQTINQAFEKYSYLNGPLSEQYHIPLLKPGENPLSRLRDLARGQMGDIFMSQHPFDRISDLGHNSPHRVKEPAELGDIRKALQGNPYFERGFLTLSQRALKGERLSDNEYTLLKLGISIYTGDLSQEDFDPKKRTYKPQDKEVVINDLKIAFSRKFTGGPDSSLSEIMTEIQRDLQKVQERISQHEASSSPEASTRSPEENNSPSRAPR